MKNKPRKRKETAAKGARAKLETAAAAVAERERCGSGGLPAITSPLGAIAAAAIANRPAAPNRRWMRVLELRRSKSYIDSGYKN